MAGNEEPSADVSNAVEEQPDEESRSSTAPPPAAASTSPKTSIQQLKKLNDANQKYKSLLKLAKSRIQTQEEELEQLRAETKRLEGLASNANNNNNSADTQSLLEAELESSSSNVVRVVQCLEDEEDGVVWALIEYDASNPEMTMEGSITPLQNRHYKKWKKFKSGFALEDYLRRDTGEPIVVPPYSLTSSQSAAIQVEAKKSVSAITEEFRRFRVKSEIAKKQADAQIKELHAQSIESTQRRIDGGPQRQQQQQQSRQTMQRPNNDQQKHLERMQRELEDQESRWKEAYNVLLAENKALKSSKSEALLAAQWRQRYETALEEKQKAEACLALELERSAEMEKSADSTKYQAKYRDLKASFKLYRHKAKEIFEAQQRGDVSTPQLLQLSKDASDDAKLDYLKNLMVQYLTASDADVKEPMERAIGTVLKFSPEELERIQQRREQEEGWFGISVG